MNLKNINSMNIIDYYNLCMNTYSRKAVGIISSKQQIFYVEKNNNMYLTHDEISSNITRTMYESDTNYESSNIYYFSTGKEFVVYIPNNISNSQLKQFTNLYNKIYEFNKSNLKKIEIIITGNNINIDENTKYEDALEQLNNIVINNEIIKKERIIGKPLSKEEIIENLSSLCELDKCNNIETLQRTILLLIHYYKDDYYKKYIEELFPNIEIIINNSNIQDYHFLSLYLC